MTTIVTRVGKGSSLSWDEMDDNLNNLNSDKLEAGFSASVVANTPAGSISATDVQAAINELDSEKAPATASTAIGTSFTAAGNITATDVQNALEELDTEKLADSFLQAGTGAVSRTYQAKVRETCVSVKDFGATGDGSTNDYAAFQAALDYAKTSGKAIFVPAGTYNIETGLVYQTTSANTFTPGLILRGEGLDKTILINKSNDELFTLSTDTSSKFQLGGEFADFSVNVGGTTTNAIAFSLKSCYYYKFSGLHINGGKIGIQLIADLGDADACNNPTIDRCRIENCTAWGVELVNGTGVNETSFLTMRQVFIQSCGTLDGVGGGMYWKGQALYMDQVAFVLCNNRGLYIEGGSGLPNTVYGVGTVFENNIGKALECWGVQGLTLVRSQAYANDASYAGTNKGHLFYFNGTSSVVRNINLDGVVIRATAANNPIVAFYVVGSNADISTITVQDVTFDNFGTTGQTAYQNITVNEKEVMLAYRGTAFNLTTTPTILPFDTIITNTSASNYTASTGVFIPLGTRAYEISAHLEFTASGAGEGLVVDLYNITDSAVIETHILRSVGAFVQDYYPVFSQVLTVGKSYGIRVQNATGTRALAVGSGVSRLLIKSL